MAVGHNTAVFPVQYFSSVDSSQIHLMSTAIGEEEYGFHSRLLNEVFLVS